MKIIFEDKEYELKISKYKDNGRICISIVNDLEEIFITNNINKLNINSDNIIILDSFVIDYGLIDILMYNKLILSYDNIDGFYLAILNLDIINKCYYIR